MEINNSKCFSFENFVRFYTNYIFFKLRQFLRDYLDRFIAEKSKSQKRRKRIFDHINFSEKELSAPFSSPKWTLSGYNGRLKDVVQSAIYDTEEIKQTEETGETEEKETGETEETEEEETGETEETVDSDALSGLSFYYSSSEE